MAPVGAAIAIIMPIICAVSLSLVDSREYPPVSDRGELLYRPRSFKPLLSTFAWLFIFFVATRYCIGSQSWADINGGIVGHLLEMTLAGFAFLWVFKFDRPIDFPMLWRFTFLFFSTAIVLGQLPCAWCDSALRCLNQVGVSLSVMLLWFLLVDISHHCSWHPCAAFGLGWASYIGSRWVVDLLNHYVPSSSFGETAALIRTGEGCLPVRITVNGQPVSTGQHRFFWVSTLLALARFFTGCPHLLRANLHLRFGRLT